MASFRTAVDCNTNVANSIKIQNLDARITEAVELLKQLIATPSRSRDEARTADLLHAFLAQRGAAPERLANNVWARAEGFDPARPTLLLNSHHDTVRPAASYTRDPYAPTVEDGKLYGLGSNDAGASVVCLLETFLTFRTRPLPFNLVLGISAEEECMGENGIRALLPVLGKVDMGAGGRTDGDAGGNRRTGTGRSVGTAHGRSGHAARGEGVNALYIALDDIARLRSFRFGRESELLGPIGIAVTQIEAGTQHNVVPDTCRFVVDVRTTDAYSNEETVGILRAALRSEARAAVDAHPRRGGRRGTSAGEGRSRRGTRNLCFADHFGPHADALPGTQDGSRTIVAVAHGRRIRPPRGDRGGNRRL